MQIPAITWRNGKIYTGITGEVIDKGYIQSNDEGRIVAVGAGSPTEGSVQVIDLEGRVIIPGMIDVHLHGGNGFDVMRPTFEDLEGISRYYAMHGTTSFLATTGPGNREEILAVLENIRRVFAGGLQGAEMLGVHLEGPFLNPLRKGAMKVEELRLPDFGEIQTYLDASGNTVKLVTMAPELKGGFELASYLIERDVNVAIGHSDALFKEVERAVHLGIRHTTHHFNGMRPMHHREPGVAGAGMIMPELTTEVIADGIHVHPSVVRLLFTVKKAMQVCAITDAVKYAGLPDGVYGESTVDEGKIHLTGSDTLAGSSLTMIQALRNVLTYTGLPLEQVLPSFTLVPACKSGAEACKGTLDIGKDADFIVLEEGLEISKTYVRGKPVYERKIAGKDSKGWMVK